MAFIMISPTRVHVSSNPLPELCFVNSPGPGPGPLIGPGRESVNQVVTEGFPRCEH